MKVAIVGSRTLSIPISEDLVPKNTTVILSGAANGMDRMARAFAQEHHIPIMEVLPDYGRYGKAAPLLRNEEIVKAADYVLAFWDGKSRGTRDAIAHCRKLKKPVRVIRLHVQTAARK